jgi:hypothetical protein
LGETVGHTLEVGRGDFPIVVWLGIDQLDVANHFIITET